MKRLVIGICAHVDAGKTTLAESLLYLSGTIRKLGRVDNKDSQLDNLELERARGITIFSKQAMLEIGDTQIALLDTPGHVDFSSDMERTLQVLDYAILVISGADGVQGHTKTLWKLLNRYEIPTFIFVNKMDQVGANKEKLLSELKKELGDNCLEFGPSKSQEWQEQVAMCDEALLENYLAKGKVEENQLKSAIQRRKIYPCFFGSALKLEGVKEFLEALLEYSLMPDYPQDFGAKIFKIARDDQGNRLTYMKITGGKLKVKDVLTNGLWEEKVNQIRQYSGKKYEVVPEVEAGSVCAVTGLSQSKPGENLGVERTAHSPLLEPVLSYALFLPEGCDPRVMLPKLRQLEEEDPGLRLVWEEELKEIQVQVMGEIQLEILQSLIKDRFGIEVSFGPGKIVYKETIANTVEGVGHFEPLRHYAEVHLLLEPGERGSGLEFASICSEDVLGKNWQRLILTHLQEKVHKGVLTGSPITDMKITLVAGRAHPKHTEGGDFREATYRAIRQGLKSAESILLEPYYAFQLEVPEKLVGRAMMDIEKMHGTCQLSQIQGDRAILTGSAPVVTLRNYHREVNAYTKGLGKLFYSLKGYEPCHNPEEVIAEIGYDSERDPENPTGSIFCANGVGFLVPWDQVKEYMHVESYFQEEKQEPEVAKPKISYHQEKWIDPEEIDRILNQTYYANQGRKSLWQKRRTAAESYYRSNTEQSKPMVSKVNYLLVDGYNIIHAWPELKELAEENMDGARMKLLEELSKFQGIQKCEIIVVFDAYRVQRNYEETMDWDNIHVVFTREAQTADDYIEKFAHDNQRQYNITVATSDHLEQMIIRGAGCAVLSADELKEEITRINEEVMQIYRDSQRVRRNYLGDALNQKSQKQIKKLFKYNQE